MFLRSPNPPFAGQPLRACIILMGVMSACAALSGCVQEMANQPRAEVFEGSPFFKDGLAARPQVPGTIARGQNWEQTPELTGKGEDGKPVERSPVELTDDLLRRGRERYGIFCSHCHGPTGYADGMVVQRGFPTPPSYHIERLLTASDGRLFEVITDGMGRMPPFGRRIEPQDRWAIVAYVRALQLSQNVPEGSLTPEERAKLPE